MTSKYVPPITTGFSRSTSSFRSRFPVTAAVPQPSLMIEMWSPATSSTSSHARGPRPLSMTWVRPWCGSKASIELLQLLLGALLHVVEERVAVTVDADGERPEILDAELPQALGHELLPVDLFDLLDLCRLERGRAADDREIDHPVLAHRLDRLVRQAALAADRAHPVVTAERLGEAHHARGGRGADADLLVLEVRSRRVVVLDVSVGDFRRNRRRSRRFLMVDTASGAEADLAHARRGVQQERAGEVERGLDSLVEDADLRAVADADDVAVDEHLVARAQLADRGFGRGKAEALRTHGRTSPPRRRRCAPSLGARPSTGS